MIEYSLFCFVINGLNLDLLEELLISLLFVDFFILFVSSFLLRKLLILYDSLMLLIEVINSWKLVLFLVCVKLLILFVGNNVNVLSIVLRLFVFMSSLRIVLIVVGNL